MIKDTLFLIIVPSNPVSMTITSSNGNTTTILENTKVTFTCSINNGLYVAWYKDNTSISSFRENNVSFTKTFSKDDKGQYMCVARNNFTKTINILVDGKVKYEAITASLTSQGNFK